MILLSCAARVSAAVIDRLGEESVESTFISGGVARGEVAAFRGPSGVEIYSDLDLYVIVRSSVDLELGRAAARQAAAAVPLGGDGLVVFPEPDIGVFTREDFLGQQTRPGTAEIADSHVVLHGSAEIPELARKFSPSGIEPAEALYLVENRLIELSALAERFERENSPGIRRYVRYVLWKSCFDVGSSVLIVLGRFHPSRAERMRRLRDARSAGECLRLLPEETSASLASWYGELSDLQGALETSPSPDRAAFDEVAGVLLENWRRTAAYISDCSAGDWRALFEWRCKAGHWFSNARELSALARRRALPRIRLIRGVGRLARLSPVNVLRLSGAARRLTEPGNGAPSPPPLGSPGSGGYIGVVDDLTRVFGYDTGDVFERARRMFEDTR